MVPGRGGRWSSSELGWRRSPRSIYLIVGLVIGLESMGIPLPGEITLVSASLMAATGGHSTPGAWPSRAAIGAIIGDSIGYAIGRRGGRPLLERLGRRFPKHLGPAQMARAEHMFARWGVWAVFFGRFIALLRILAGPMAGALKVPYRKFLLANAAGGLVWAFGTAFAIYSIGEVAEAVAEALLLGGAGPGRGRRASAPPGGSSTGRRSPWSPPRPTRPSPTSARMRSTTPRTSPRRPRSGRARSGWADSFSLSVGLRVTSAR